MANTKKGVSLIVVMLFMLVATIAATATFRWLSRQSDASASRMRTNEAYQSAVAGIDAARSWMTYHANDVGALLKQYEDDNRKPVKLNSRIAAFSRGGQIYDVWLVGSNTDSKPYKLKLLSSGKSRNGSVYNVEAVLNVQGLYRVQLPGMGSEVNFEYAYFGGSTKNHGNMNPSAMLVNGNWEGNPNEVTNNFVVTGNASLSGNNLSIGKTACIGGNLSTQNGFKGKDLYVAGNATSFNAAISGDAYFAGDVEMGSVSTPGFSVTGSVTLDGKMTTDQSAFHPQIGGNFCATSDAVIYSSGTNNPFEVFGNTWIDNPNGIFTGNDNSGTYDKIVFGKDKNSSVYIRSAHPYSDYEKLMEKSFTEDMSFRKKCNDNNQRGPYEDTHAKCDYFDPWDNGSYSPYVKVNPAPDKYYLYHLPADTADVEFKSYQNSYWAHCTSGPGSECQSYAYPTTIYAYFVGNQLYYDLGYKWNSFRADLNGSNITGSPYCYKRSDFHPVCGVSPWFKVGGTLKSWTDSPNFCVADSLKSRCDSLWEKKPGCDGSSYKVDDMLQTAESAFSSYASKGCAAGITVWNNDLSKNLNACYEELSGDADKAKENLYNGYLVVKVSYSSKQDPKEPLKGKFIIIVDNQMGQNSLPPTTEDSYVFLLLKEGGNGEIQDAVPGITNKYNYFIYTEKDATKLLFKSTLSGSVYATAENCSKIGDLDIAKIEYNQSLMNSLTQSKIICNADAAVCGGATSSSGASSSEYTMATGKPDAYYTAMAPQLSISLESQYAHKGNLPDDSAEELSSSFIVLPRVAYLPRDPYGKLSDYYKVVSLNSSEPFKETGIRCESLSGGTASIPTVGLMFDRKSTNPELLTKGIYGCTVSAESKATSGEVPFYVVVSGEESSAPEVQFGEAQLQLKKGNSTKVVLTVPTTTAAPANCKVSIIRPAETLGWSVTPMNGISCNGENCTIDINTSAATTEIFDVQNESAITSGLLFQISEVEGCNIGQNNFEYIYNSSSVSVQRKGLAAFCAGPGSANEKCKIGGEYEKWIQSDRPNCSTTEEWVMPNCNDRVTGLKNEDWTCSADGSDFTFVTPSVPNGCEAVIPTASEGNLLRAADLNPENSETYFLYGELKAEAQTFFVGFEGEGIQNSQTISISVTGNGERNHSCSYADYKANSDNCSFAVYTGETVTLSLKTAADKENFNYWECASGLDCPDNSEPFTGDTYVISVTDGDVVMAHFGESDKHCFFDEFKNHGLECSSGNLGGNAEYCIDECAGDVCNVGLGKNSFAKWLLLRGDRNRIEFLNDGKIQYSSTAIREDSKLGESPVMVLSTVMAGLYGTLKAQFQVPMLGGVANESEAMVKKSGFLLRSNSKASEYLLLTIFGNASRELRASLCKQNGDCVEEAAFKQNGSSVSVGSSQIVLLSATFGKVESGKDALQLEVSLDSWSSSKASVVFELPNADLIGSEKLNSRGIHEYVGFSLADPNFKLYGIGWKSDDYASTCWDTYPTVSCSFKAAYAGGIVPQNEETKPWVGLSAWFDSKGCFAKYYYQGKDACGGTQASYSECSSGYLFTEGGPHGVLEPMTLAKAKVSGCALGGEESSWMENAEDDCGSFWVGEFTACSEDVNFIQGSGDGEGIYFPVSALANKATVNLRDASLVLDLSNEQNSEVQVYLYSQNSSDGFSYGSAPVYSLPWTTTQTGSVTFSMDDLMTVDGFDVEHVAGVYIKNVGASSVKVNSVQSSCPNVLRLLNCSAQYVSTSNAWKIAVGVTNPSQVKSFEIKEVGVNLSGKASCDETDALPENHCKWTGNVAMFNWTDNPYGSSETKNYAFQVSLKNAADELVDGSPFECRVTQPSAITATCDGVSKKTVFAGEGLPVFQYSLLNCPEGKGCDYRVVLDASDEILSEKNHEGGSGLATSTTAANIKEDPLTTGTHRFTLESTSADKAFNSCSLEFDVVEAESSSSAEESSSSVEESSSSEELVSSSSAEKQLSVKCGLSMNNYSFGESSTYYRSKDIYIVAQNNVNENESYPLELYEGESSLGEFLLKANTNLSVMLLGKRSVGSYNWTLKYKGVTQCVVYAEVISALSCSVSETEIGLGEPFTWKTLYAGYCRNSSITGNGVSQRNCAESHTITPTEEGTLQYVFHVVDGELGKDSCSQTITVKERAPTITCPADQTEKTGSSVSVLPKALEGCGKGCTYEISLDGNSLKSGTDYSGGAVSFPGESVDGTYSYLFRVSNSEGSDDCNFSVTYSADVMSNSACLGNDNGWPEIKNIVDAGEYKVLHDCKGSQWFYQCSGTVSYGSTTLECNNVEHKDIAVSTMPASGSVLIIPEGSSVSKLGCDRGSGTSPCGTTGITKY